MPKRSADSEPQQTQPARKSVGGNAAPAAGGDEGMGEFEDQWEDDLSDEEIVNAGDLEGDDGVMLDDEIIPAAEDSDPTAGQNASDAPTYLPGHSRPLEDDETLEPDNSVYQSLHRLAYTWPCLSFDVLRDNLGWERGRFPHTAWVVAGTQAGESEGGAGGMSVRGKDEVVVMRLGGLSRTQKDGNDSDDSSDDEDDDADGTDEDAHLEFLSIPHTGSVNRIRAAPQPPSPSLLPPTPTPYHVASMSETGKVHIFDVRPLIDQLEQPGSQGIAQRLEKAKRPLHTITNHGRNEGFALDWAGSFANGSQTPADLRLLTGDVASKIFLTTATNTGFHTNPNPYISHTNSIEDLQWSPSEPTVFASCSSDRSLKIWDIRVKSRKNVTGIDGAHTGDVNVISWNKGVGYLVVSGGDEGGLKTWDLRSLKADIKSAPTPVAHFQWHTQPITSVEWSPHDTSLFLASSADDSVTMWDLSVEADEDESANNATRNIVDAQGRMVAVPPQLLFVHQGQRDVKEVHWHPQVPGMVVSTAGDGFNVFKTISA
ncbi:hypothetical protein QFC22_001668 [Naganishia vaughanmartiniae]|uniref:Uncharacterized protein n=1 Tax=Naganishia vaughanmartiniae TaxID=1424756 RepID=A0ACC2XEK0_9TREE|nr:hypothetical protein QFC22_001668 [Naganishia vaughanmartiniae]